ncbi:bacteriocin-like protein [Chryseobacterium jejuense]
MLNNIFISLFKPKSNNMKNLKKLSKGKLKTISGGISFPYPGECFYGCSDGIQYKALCRLEFFCPDGEQPIIY